MSLYLNINFLPKIFPKALELWQLADLSNGLLNYEKLTKLVNINKCTKPMAVLTPLKPNTHSPSNKCWGNQSKTCLKHYAYLAENQNQNQKQK